MSVILKVANVHFDAAGTSRIDYATGNIINVVANTNGLTITQNTFYPIQSNTMTIGTSSVPIANIHMADSRQLHFGNNVKIFQDGSGNIRFTGAGHSYSIDAALKGENSPSPTLLKIGNVQLFTSNSTWTKPTGCRYIKVTVQGGGGGGGSATVLSGYNAYGGGGGAGSIGIKWLDVSSWSNSTTVTIGSGGGSSISLTFGAYGNTSSFGTHVTAAGGDGGQFMAGALTWEFYRGAIEALSASGGDINIPSSAGEPSMRINGSAGVSGRGGKSFLGFAAPGGNQNTTNFVRSGTLGGGGGGAAATTANTSGGSGGTGFVLVEEYY